MRKGIRTHFRCKCVLIGCQETRKYAGHLRGATGEQISFEKWRLNCDLMLEANTKELRATYSESIDSRATVKLGEWNLTIHKVEEKKKN